MTTPRFVGWVNSEIVASRRTSRWAHNPKISKQQPVRRYGAPLPLPAPPLGVPPSPQRSVGDDPGEFPEHPPAIRQPHGRDPHAQS